MTWRVIGVPEMYSCVLPDIVILSPSLYDDLSVVTIMAPDWPAPIARGFVFPDVSFAEFVLVLFKRAGEAKTGTTPIELTRIASNANPLK
jgi:hypothetical protein